MKAEIRICFYDSTPLQGWRKWVIRLMQGTYHSHAHIELRFDTCKIILMTLDGEKPRAIKLGLNKKFLGVDPYAEFSCGEQIIHEDAYSFLLRYPATHHFELIWYQILRYFGLENRKKIPPTCTTFISDFLYSNTKVIIPCFFSPKQLWRYLHER